VNVEVLDVLIKDNSDTVIKLGKHWENPQQVGEGKIYNLLDLTGVIS
jgi:hypothetical protein